MPNAPAFVVVESGQADALEILVAWLKALGERGCELLKKVVICSDEAGATAALSHCEKHIEKTYQYLVGQGIDVDIRVLYVPIERGKHHYYGGHIGEGDFLTLPPFDRGSPHRAASIAEHCHWITVQESAGKRFREGKVSVA